MYQARAAGKLYLAGEYAVVSPHHTALAVAVDRFVTVKLTPSDRGTFFSKGYSPEPLKWVRENNMYTFKPIAFKSAQETIRIVEEIAFTKGRQLGLFHVHIESELISEDGEKFGLGSSGAVTIALAKALSKMYNLKLSPLEIFKIGALAHQRMRSNGSYGDLAASAYGGFIAYTMFDRSALISAIVNKVSTTDIIFNMEWPGLEIKHLHFPKAWKLLVGWTQTPASTSDLVSQVYSRNNKTYPYGQFLRESRKTIKNLIKTFEHQDFPGVKQHLKDNRSQIQRMKNSRNSLYSTPELENLIRIAEDFGGAAKIAGAGGGDCAYALFYDANLAVQDIYSEWSKHGIVPLELNITDELIMEEDSCQYIQTEKTNT